jgi:hypothetical protein
VPAHAFGPSISNAFLVSRFKRSSMARSFPVGGPA